MSTPKDRANDPNRKSAHNHTDAELLEKFNEIHARLTAKPTIKYELDTREGSFGPDGKPISGVSRRSWGTNGKP
jgi:hypothetical protein